MRGVNISVTRIASTSPYARSVLASPYSSLGMRKRNEKLRVFPEFATSKRDVRKRAPAESDRRCPPTSASDFPGSRRERDGDVAARVLPLSPGSPDRCPPRRHGSSTNNSSNTRITTVPQQRQEGQEEGTASAAGRTRDSVDGPQGRRPNPRTTPQLLATKVPLVARVSRFSRCTSSLNFSWPAHVTLS